MQIDFEAYRVLMEDFLGQSGMQIAPEEVAAYYEDTDMTPAEAAAAYRGQIAFEMTAPGEEFIMNPNDCIERMADIRGDATRCNEW